MNGLRFAALLALTTSAVWLLVAVAMGDPDCEGLACLAPGNWPAEIWMAPALAGFAAAALLLGLSFVPQSTK